MGNQVHIAAVLGGRATLDAWRAQHPHERLDLSQADLSDRPLGDLDLTDADLTEVRFNNSVLHGCALAGADVTRTDFTGATLFDSSLAGIRGSRTVLRDATLRELSLDGAELVELRAHGLTMVDCDLHDADLAGAQLTGCHITDCRFSFGSLHGADLANAHLRDVTMLSCDLTASDLRGVIMRDVGIDQGQLFKTRWREAKLRSVRFDAPDLQSARLIGCRLWDCQFATPKVRDASFSGSRMTKVEFIDADDPHSWLFDRVKARRTTWEGCNFTSGAFGHAKMDRCYFTRCKFEAADFERAKLGRTIFEDCTLAPVSTSVQSTTFERADLQSTRFLDCSFGNTTCDKAIVGPETLIWDCDVSESTQFHGVPLRSSRIQPHTLARLERNGRVRFWESWYLSHPFKGWFYRQFWKMSDYGTSGRKLVKTFLVWAVVFAGIYAIPTAMTRYANVPIDPFIANLDTHEVDRTREDATAPDAKHAPRRVTKDLPSRVVAVRALYFSVVTMTTLGFGDMSAAPTSVIGQTLLMIQVLLGYIILGAIVTRLSIAFQATG